MNSDLTRKYNFRIMNYVFSLYIPFDNDFHGKKKKKQTTEVLIKWQF